LASEREAAVPAPVDDAGRRSRPQLVRPPTAEDLLAERVIETMRPLSGLVAATMAFFVLYNAIDLPAGVREIAMIYDVVCVVAFGATWLLLGRRAIGAAQMPPIACGLALLLLGNILTVQALLRVPFYSFYVGIVILGIAITMTSRAWALGTLAVTWASAAPVLWLASQDDVQVFGRHVGFLVSVTAVGAGIFVSRVAKERKLAELRIRDYEQRLALEDALVDAEEARASLDAQVEERTAELRAANAALTQEVEERRRAETEASELLDQLRHAQRMESIGRLAGGVAHDFNNFLAVILANLDLALSDHAHQAVDPAVLKDARHAAERATEVTRQLLAFSRKQVIDREVFDAVSRVEDMSSILHTLLEDRAHLVIKPLVDAVWVDADPAQIEQVVMNLVVNARDAMPSGGTIEIDIDEIERDGTATARVRVIDEGLGIDAGDLEHIFEPFYTTKPVGRGTGLGLSTAYGICKQHGGVLEVASSPGQGSTFDVCLPAVPPPRESATLVPKSTPPGSETVLLVEDEPAVRRVGERILRRLGYHVMAAGSAEEAIRLFRGAEEEVDLLWTDIQMPGMNGIELAAELRRTRPNLGVLYVSGYTGDYLKSCGVELREGVNFAYKPFRAPQIARMIRNIIQPPSASRSTAPPPPD
jgi:signal transduction histidine kinase/CheY-like chemotaxis protein